MEFMRIVWKTAEPQYNPSTLVEVLFIYRWLPNVSCLSIMDRGQGRLLLRPQGP